MKRLQFIPEVLLTGNGFQRLRDIVYRLEGFYKFLSIVQYHHYGTSCPHRRNPSYPPIKATM